MATIATDVIVVYEQQEYYVSTTLELGNRAIAIDLLQCQLLSLVGLLPDEQILVTSRGEIIASPHASLELVTLPLAKEERPRVFLFDAKRADLAVPADASEICTRCVFGATPVVQPAFRKIGAGDTDALICAACAQTCSTDTEMVSPLAWRSSKSLASRFISELLIIVGASDVPIPSGYKKVPGDLNYSASGDYVHLFIKRGGNRIVTQLAVGSKVSSAGSNSSTTWLPGDCSSGNGSDSPIFVGYDTVSRGHHEALYTYGITDVCLCVGDEPTPSGFIKVKKDLNAGALGEAVIALYLCYKLAPIGGFSCATQHGAFQECLFQSRHAVATMSVASGASPQGDTVLATLDNARQRADSAFLESHYNQHEPAMRARLQGGLSRVRAYEDPTIQAEALRRIPVEKLHERARTNPNPKSSYQDELVMQLTHWFKREFFSWMNQPKCSTCGHDKTRMTATESATTPEEHAGQASRVEVYQCPQCRAFTRFPRYNDPVKLLDTRTGRCGEWANCFTLCCRAMGFEARYVLDVTDHVWTEVYSEHQKRWLHCDSCEDQLDCPLTYEVGWGKKLSYIFSFSYEEVVDSARRYTQNWDEMCLRRQDVSEPWLERTISSMNQTLRLRLPHDRVQLLEQRATVEREEFERGRTATPTEIQGRVSGSDEWKSQRSEDGKQLDAKLGSSMSPITLNSPASPSAHTIGDVTQQLMKNLLVGCGRGEECPNPHCLHRRVRVSPDLSPTDRAAQALQLVASLHQQNFSPEGFATLLCPTVGDVREFLLSQRPDIYLPLQDSVQRHHSLLVDCSGSGRHAESSCALHKPFTLPIDGATAENAHGVQLFPDRSLTIAAPINHREFALSWLTRFDRAHNIETASACRGVMSVQINGRLSLGVVADEDMQLRIELGYEDRLVRSEAQILRFGAYYHFAVVLCGSPPVWHVVVNSKSVVQIDAELDARKSLHVEMHGPKSEASKYGVAMAVIAHLTVLPVDNFANFQHFCEVMRQRYVAWPPLEAFDHNGSREDKQCRLPIARLQSGFRVGRVRMWGGDFFDGIQLVYLKDEVDAPAKQVEGPLIGNSKAHESASSPSVELVLLPGEVLTRLDGRKGAWTDCIRITTSFGRSVACGGRGGGDFQISLPRAHVQIRAISFSVGDHLVDAIVYIGEAPDPTQNELFKSVTLIVEGVEASKLQSAINAASRYLDNIAKTPDDLKFQKIRASNKFFAANVGCLEPQVEVEFMKWCGFVALEESCEKFYEFNGTTKSAEKTAWALARLYFLKELAPK